MAELRKGRITSIAGDMAIVKPYDLGATVTPLIPNQRIKIDVPTISSAGHIHPGFTIITPHPVLSIGKDVVFVMFEDGTGTIIGDA